MHSRKRVMEFYCNSSLRQDAHGAWSERRATLHPICFLRQMADASSGCPVNNAMLNLTSQPSNTSIMPKHPCNWFFLWRLKLHQNAWHLMRLRLGSPQGGDGSASFPAWSPARRSLKLGLQRHQRVSSHPFLRCAANQRFGDVFVEKRLGKPGGFCVGASPSGLFLVVLFSEDVINLHERFFGMLWQILMTLKYICMECKLCVKRRGRQLQIFLYC